MPAGPGGLDANGVRRYGEADTQALFSDLLNLGMDSVSAQFVVDRARMTTDEANITTLQTQMAARPWIPVIPTGYTLGGTGSAVIDATTGKVSLTSVQTSIIIAACHPANTDVEFEGEIVLASGGTIGYTLRTGAGVDATGHDQQFSYSDTSASVGSLRVTNAAAWQMYQSSKTEHIFGGRLLHANEAVQTRLRLFEFTDSTAATADLVSGAGGGRNRGTAAYSACKLTFSQLATGWIKFKSRAA